MLYYIICNNNYLFKKFLSYHYLNELRKLFFRVVKMLNSNSKSLLTVNSYLWDWFLSCWFCVRKFWNVIDIYLKWVIINQRIKVSSSLSSKLQNINSRHRHTCQCPFGRWPTYNTSTIFGNNSNKILFVKIHDNTCLKSRCYRIWLICRQYWPRFFIFQLYLYRNCTWVAYVIVPAVVSVFWSSVQTMYSWQLPVSTGAHPTFHEISWILCTFQ